MIGRQYLASRGISRQVLDHEESAGFLVYAGLPGARLGFAVLFVGRDDKHRIRAVTRRGVFDDGKRDLVHTDKRFCPILPGSPEEVWVVEGGVDALAVHELAWRQGRGERPPTVIVTGGAHVRAPFDDEATPAYQILRRAERVFVAHEREGDAETQRRTDDAHRRQAELIRRIVRPGATVEAWWPPQGVKDVADLAAGQGVDWAADLPAPGF